VLVLERKPGASLRLDIGEGVEIVVKEIKGGQVKLAISAPADVRILREEVRNDPTRRLSRPKASAPDDSTDLAQTGHYAVLGLPQSKSD